MGDLGGQSDSEDDDVELEVVRASYEPMMPPPPMEALYQLNSNGSLPGRSSGIQRFRNTSVVPSHKQVKQLH